MTDKFSREERSSIMAKVHSYNTLPEIKIRKLLHSMGYRFRLHRNDLPGNPDIVLPKHNTVIFVHGCFWHGCPVCLHAQVRPKTNSDYWNKKLNRNIQRDEENYIALNNLGWRIMIVWECETKKRNLPMLCTKIEEFLS